MHRINRRRQRASTRYLSFFDRSSNSLALPWRRCFSLSLQSERDRQTDKRVLVQLERAKKTDREKVNLPPGNLRNEVRV